MPIPFDDVCIQTSGRATGPTWMTSPVFESVEKVCAESQRKLIVASCWPWPSGQTTLFDPTTRAKGQHKRNGRD